MRLTVAALTACLALASQAQSPQPSPASESPAPASPATAAEAPAAESPAQEATNTEATPTEATPTEEERLSTIEGKIAAAEEKAAETNAFLDQLRKIKFSGYVQGRYTYTEGQPTNGFTVRRGRLKATYASEWAQYVLQIDATPSGVSLKDAEATLIEPWTGQKLSLTVGQTKWPFGYEVLQSSGDREFPERTRVVRAFAPGERDRGAKVNARLGLLRLNLGVFDGNGTEFKADNDKSKDVVGRLGLDLKWLAAGVSGWWGESNKPFEAGVGGYFPRNRLGLDAQLYLDLLEFGGTQLRGEFIAGRTYLRSGVEQFGVPALGWYAILVQNFGLENQLALRYDYFDGAAGRVDGASGGRPSSTNGIGTFGIALIHHLNEVLEVTAAYELPLTNVVPGVTDPADNVLTLQMQAKF